MVVPALAGMRGMEMVGLGQESASLSLVVLGLSCYILLKNWLGNVAVTYASSVVKYVIYAMALPVAYLAELLLGWRLVALPTVIVVALVCMGVWMFAQDGQHAPTERTASEPAPAAALMRRFSSRTAREAPAAAIAPAPIVPGTAAWDEESAQFSNS
jgi:hypothetical protein